ncbi:MAG TPA: hypothetical protein VFJ82_08325 [Longimicrobium sp.]|nr:hypothetical protein [Longimicrobium sp.]
MKRTHTAFLLFLPVAAACGTVGYAVPGELSTTAPVPVSGRQGVLVNQRLSFGEYATDPVRRSFTRGTDEHDVLATDHGEYRQRYQFALNRGGAKVADVACTAEGSGAQTLNVTWRSKRTLDCEVKMGSGELRMIRLDSSRDRPLSGRVTGDPAFAVTGSDRVKGGRIDGTAGYTIARDNGSAAAAAAVDVTGNGAVFMQGAQDDAVAAIAAALLLYQDPLEASERFRR